jgi:hypothetical protein
MGSGRMDSSAVSGEPLLRLLGFNGHQGRYGVCQRGAKSRKTMVCEWVTPRTVEEPYMSQLRTLLNKCRT